MNDGIERPLQKRRVDRAERLQPLRRHSCRKNHRMLFRDPNIEIAFRMVRPEQVQRGSIRHRRRNRDHFVVRVGQLHHSLRKHFRSTSSAPAALVSPVSGSYGPSP